MKNRGKKISLILFSLLMVFSMNKNIFAAVEHNGLPGSVNKINSSTLPNRIDSYAGSQFRGIRVSFVTNTGYKIFTRDYVIDSQYDSIEDRGFKDYYYVGAKCSKVSYINGKCSFYTWSKATNETITYQMDKLSNLRSIFENYNFSIGDVESYILQSNFAVSTATDDWFKKSSYDTTNGDNYASDLKGLLSEFKLSGYLTPDKISNVFVVIEPVTIVTIHESHFYGTVYELADAASLYAAYVNVRDSNGEKLKDENGNYIIEIRENQTALDVNLQSILKKNYTCGSYLTKDLYSKMVGYNKVVSGFSGSTYFNKIAINTEYQSVCTSSDKVLTTEQATGAFGVGMKIIWMYEYWEELEEKVLTCPLINGINTQYNTNKISCSSNEVIDELVNNFIKENTMYTYDEVREYYHTNCCDASDVPPTKPSCQTIVDNAEDFKGRDYTTITKDEVISLLKQFEEAVISKNLNYNIPTAEEYWNGKDYMCGNDGSDGDDPRYISPTCEQILEYASKNGVTGTPMCNDDEKIRDIVEGYNFYIVKNPFDKNNPLYNLKQVEEDFVNNYKEVLKCPCIIPNDEKPKPDCDEIIRIVELMGSNPIPTCDENNRKTETENIMAIYNNYVRTHPDYKYGQIEEYNCGCNEEEDDDKVKLECKDVYNIVALNNPTLALPTCGNQSSYNQYINIFNTYMDAVKNPLYDITKIDYNFFVENKCDCQEVYEKLTCKEIYTTAYGNTYGNLLYSNHYSDGLRECSNATTNSIVNEFNTKVDDGATYTKITTDDFNTICPCITKSEICAPDIMVNSCDSFSSKTVKYDDNNGIYTDEQEFINKCIVNQTSKKDNNLSQTYCNVYCYESLDMNLSKFTVPVTAGRFVSFNYTYTNTVSGSRTCYTEPDLNSYFSDLNDANEKLLDLYVEYYKEYLKENAIENPTNHGESSRCPYIYGTEYLGGESFKQCKEAYWVDEDECTLYKMVTDMETGEVTLDNTVNDCGKYYDSSRCEWDEDTYKCIKWHSSCDGNYDYTRGTRYSASHDSVTIAGKPISFWSDEWCSNGGSLGTKPNYYSGDEWNSYDKQLTFVKDLISSINSCFSWEDDDLYNLDPTLTLNYSDGYLYNHSTDLVVDDYNEYNSSPDYTLSSDNSKRNSWIYSCSEDKCTKETLQQVYAKYKKSRNIDITYKLPNNTFNYITKGSDVTSLLTVPSGNYITLGGNLPVAYGASGTGELNIDYSGLGHNSNTGYNTKLENTLSSEVNYGKWYCDFDIYAGLVKENGLNLVYRTIDLNNPFPDINGEGRNVGSNWCAATGVNRCSNTNTLVQSVIKTDVMDGEPMYSFTLTPSTILYIREYNKNNPYDDFNLTCEEGTGKACVSNFIDDLIDAIDDTYVSGECIVAREGNKSSFYSCEPEPYKD